MKYKTADVFFTLYFRGYPIPKHTTNLQKLLRYMLYVLHVKAKKVMFSDAEYEVQNTYVHKGCTSMLMLQSKWHRWKDIKASLD